MKKGEKKSERTRKSSEKQNCIYQHLHVKTWKESLFFKDSEVPKILFDFCAWEIFFIIQSDDKDRHENQDIIKVNSSHPSTLTKKRLSFLIKIDSTLLTMNYSRPWLACIVYFVCVSFLSIQISISFSHVRRYVSIS